MQLVVLESEESNQLYIMELCQKPQEPMEIAFNGQQNIKDDTEL